MLSLTKIIFNSIAYVTEDSELVEQAIHNCVPEILRSYKLQKSILQSQFNDQLILYSISFDKPKEIDEIINFIVENLGQKDKEYLNRHFEAKLDIDNKSFYFRINKFNAVDSNLELSEGSDVIKVEIKYLAYTNGENSLDKIKKFFQNRGIVSHD